MKKTTLFLLTFLLCYSTYAQVTDLFYIDFSDNFIRKLNLDGSGTVSDVLDVAGQSGAYIAYSTTNEKVYWSDFTNSAGTSSNSIRRMDLDGSNPEVIISGLNDPWGIAIDNTNGKIYWGDSDGTVSKADLDGTNQEIGFFSVSGAQWTGISLDVENNKMYLYDYWIEDIYAVNMDGTNDQIILPGIGYGYSMFVDTVNDKLYYDEWGTAEKLFRCNLDGSNVQEVNSTLASRTYGIAIDYADGAGKLYYSGRDSGEIYRSDLDGSNLEVLKTGLASPRGLFLYTDPGLGIGNNVLTGIKIEASNKSIALYNLPQTTNYRVYSITGQSVLDGNTNESNHVIDAKTLASGVYIVEVEDAITKAKMQKKIIL